MRLYHLRILEFHIEFPKGLGDDIVGNSRIPKTKSKIPSINLELLELKSRIPKTKNTPKTQIKQENSRF